METESKKVRYWGSVWGQKPGWGFYNGWCFGETPEAAAADLLADGVRWARGKYAMPAELHLKDERGNYASFLVAPDGSMSVKPEPAWLTEMLARSP